MWVTVITSFFHPCSPQVILHIVATVIYLNKKSEHIIPLLLLSKPWLYFTQRRAIILNYGPQRPRSVPQYFSNLISYSFIFPSTRTSLTMLQLVQHAPSPWPLATGTSSDRNAFTPEMKGFSSSLLPVFVQMSISQWCLSWLRFKLCPNLYPARLLFLGIYHLPME